MTLAAYLKKKEPSIAVQVKLPISVMEKLDAVCEDLAQTRTHVVRALVERVYDEMFEPDDGEDTDELEEEIENDDS